VTELLRTQTLRHKPAALARLNIIWFRRIPLLRAALGRRAIGFISTRTVMFPTIELFFTLAVSAVVVQQGVGPASMSRLLFVALMTALFVIPLRTPEFGAMTPNGLTIPGIALGLATSWLPGSIGLMDSVLGAATGGFILWAIGEAYYRYSDAQGMGGGAVKLLALIGSFVGFQLVVLTLVLSSILGSIIGMVLLVRGGGMRTELPYSAYLAVAGLIAGSFGKGIVTWYLAFYK
jgi:leader peptidase (prepilin peptidase) / N-methyltransferase